MLTLWSGQHLRQSSSCQPGGAEESEGPASNWSSGSVLSSRDVPRERYWRSAKWGTVSIVCLDLLLDSHLFARQCNLDFVFLASLVSCLVLYLLATFDIACQYFVNFWQRMPELPEGIHLNIPRENVTVKVPKAHLPVHKTSCHGLFSLNFTKGAGRTDGEWVERLWSWLNRAAPSTKEMGPSARRETIDDFCLYGGWRKTVQLRKQTFRWSLACADSSSSSHHVSSPCRSHQASANTSRRIRSVRHKAPRPDPWEGDGMGEDAGRVGAGQKQAVPIHPFHHE